MKVLLVTAKLAGEVVKYYAAKSKVETEVVVLPMPVAALMNSKYIARELKKTRIQRIDIILVPGLVFGDVSQIEKNLGKKVFKGPKYAADIPKVLELIDQIILSKITPACEILSDKMKINIDVELRKAEKKAIRQNIDQAIKIGNIWVGRGFPMRVMVEIVDAPLKTEEEIVRLTRKYIKNGATIIDVGMIAGECHPQDASRIVQLIKKKFNVPVSIDSLDIEECKAAVDAGANLILSFGKDMLKEGASFAKNTPIVIVPLDKKTGYIPKEPKKRIALLEKTISEARNFGIKKIIADPITDILISPGLMQSLYSHYLFRQSNPDIPLFMGLANVTELIDADSIGVSAILAGLAQELGASIILATEASNKTIGMVKELSLASKMMCLAQNRNCPPKDVGATLLVLKDKRIIDDPLLQEDQHMTKVFEDNKEIRILDRSGSFKIVLDREADEIVVYYYPMKKGEAESMIRGRTALGIARKVTELGLISRLDHATYLGAELQKCEIALQIGKGYIQDSKLF